MNTVSWQQWDHTENRHVLMEYDLDVMTQTERANLYVQRLNTYDLTYAYSDDHSVYMSGERSRGIVWKIAATLPRKIAEEEYNRMVARNFTEEYLQTEEGKGWLYS